MKYESTFLGQDGKHCKCMRWYCFLSKVDTTGPESNKRDLTGIKVKIIYLDKRKEPDVLMNIS